MKFLLTALPTAMIAAAAWAGPAAAQATASPATQAFERLKSLAGR